MEIVSKDYNALVPLLNSSKRLGRVADAERLRRRSGGPSTPTPTFPDDVRARILMAADLPYSATPGASIQVKLAVAMRPGRKYSLQCCVHLRPLG